MKTHSKTREVVFVDDDPNFGNLVSRWLELEGFPTEVFLDGESFLHELSRLMPSCVCLDLSLPDIHGLTILERLQFVQKNLPVIILTAESSAEEAVKAMHLGAYDYLVKPVDRAKLVASVRNAVERHKMVIKLSQFERESRGDTYGMVGKSSAMQKLFREIDRVAGSDISVVIRGESGTGKELVAKAIHANSGRADGNLVAINCAAIPESLQESELFGHEKGSFTGADKRRIGRFEEANGGTLFLDEVAELSLAVQAKLLRVLQEKAFSRLGGTGEIHSDFRLIAASHKDLISEVDKGRFRDDLFYRIAVYELDVPALRYRGDDVVLLAKQFLEHFSKRHGRKLTLAPETLMLLKAYEFPGNVRELQNYMQRAVVACGTNVVTPADLPNRMNQADTKPKPSYAEDSQPPANMAAFGNTFDEGNDERNDEPNGREWETFEHARVPEKTLRFENMTLREIEKEAIKVAIERNEGNISGAGHDLGIGRTTLYRKIKEYEIVV
ncbi:MAG: sigma-54-dependent transcriptional regulator [Pyrinomonadaceae bacterium]